MHGCPKLEYGLTQLKPAVGFLVWIIFLSHPAFALCPLVHTGSFARINLHCSARWENFPQTRLLSFFGQVCIAQIAKSWLVGQAVFTSLILCYQKVSLSTCTCSLKSKSSCGRMLILCTKYIQHYLLSAPDNLKESFQDSLSNLNPGRTKIIQKI